VRELSAQGIETLAFFSAYGDGVTFPFCVLMAESLGMIRRLSANLSPIATVWRAVRSCVCTPTTVIGSGAPVPRRSWPVEAHRE